jgi:hypothetical protein
MVPRPPRLVVALVVLGLALLALAALGRARDVPAPRPAVVACETCGLSCPCGAVCPCPDREVADRRGR